MKRFQYVKNDSSLRVGLIMTLALLFILIFSLTSHVNAANPSAKGAASGSAASGEPVSVATPVPTPTPTPPPPGKAKLRLMYTTDIHGQITGMDYQRQTPVVRGLDRVSTMMTKAREEMGNRNCMAFDVGDSIMDYTTDFIYSRDPYAIQPVYKAMASLNYDAITIGNHEFDYGLDYLTEQLNGSGLMKKVVLSNCTSKYTGAYVFGAENKIIEKEVIDENGNSRIVKVGLFGATPPMMSSKTEKSSSSLKTISFYNAAVQEVAKLKEKGADIIIALAHTGVGTENPSDTAPNAGYAMTKVNGLDVILGGHQHIFFPSDTYSYLPGVNKSNWLVNGTRFLVLRDSARALGIVDLNLSFDSMGRLTLTSSDYNIRMVNNNVTPDPAITSFMDEWGKKITEASSVKVGDIGSNRWTTYMGILESNPIMQTVQNAQRAYAYQYIHNYAPEYKDWPIICATRYGVYGNESGKEYGDVTGTVTAGRMQDFARYHQYITIYEITGAQLKEWIEWTASVYQQIGTSRQSQWDDSLISEYVFTQGGDSLVTNENVREWKNYFCFGGIEYTIDPRFPARYSRIGNRISNYERVTSLTYNGVPIEPDQKFVIASDQLYGFLQAEATSGISSKKIFAEKKLLQNVVADYLSNYCLLPTTDMTVTTNWTLDLPSHYRFMMMTGDDGKDIVTSSKWYSRTCASANGYSYFECLAPEPQATDDKPPCLTLVPSSYDTSDNPVTIRVLANDKNGITEVKYTEGTRSTDDANWDNEYAFQYVTDGTVTVEKSGIYTFYVKDAYGNATTQSIAITNIDPEILRIPTIDKVDNNDTYVSGTAQVGATINVVIGKEHYQDKVDGDGYYSVDIPVQKARTVIRCYVSDSKGRASAEVSTRVRRVGPNKPTGSAQNNSYYVKGSTNDDNVNIYALVRDQIYVSKKLGTTYYKKCKKYDKTKTIKKVSITISKTGTYSIQVPHLSPGEKVKVYTIDQFGRVSATKTVTVSRAAFEPVACYASFSSEKAVFGRIREGKKGYVQAYYADGKKAGSGYSDSHGYFHFNVSRGLQTDEQLKLYAKYNSSTKSKSHPATLTIDNIADADTGEDLLVKRITSGDTEITGTTDYKNGILSVICDGSYRIRTATATGTFKVKLPQPVKKDDVIYVLIRTHNGYFETCKKKTVTEGPPSKPVVVEARKDAGEVIVSHKKEVTMTLKVKKQLYSNPKVYYSKTKGLYYYTFDGVSDLEEGTRIVATAKNEGGKTKSNPFYVP